MLKRQVLAVITFGTSQAIGAKKETVLVDGYRVSAELRGLGSSWFTVLDGSLLHEVWHMRQLSGLEIWEGHEYLQLEHIAGWDFHPLGKRRLTTAHASSGHWQKKPLKNG